MQEETKRLQPEDLKDMSESTLISIYKSFNYWQWPLLLGPEPEGWDEMPNYRKPHMDEKCPVKEDFMNPYARVIRSLVSWDDLHEAIKVRW